MKLRFAIIPALLATALFAQDPNGFRPGPFNGPPGDAPQGREFGRRGPGREGRMGMFGRGMRREMGLERLLSDPNLRQQIGVSADQAAKIRQQESDFRKTEIRGRADLQIKRMELADLLAADKPDRSAVDSKVQEVGAAQTAMEKAAIDHRLEMRDALTPAQRQKIEQLMEQRRGAAFGGNAAAPRGPQAAGRGGRRAGAPPNPPAPPKQ